MPFLRCLGGGQNSDDDEPVEVHDAQAKHLSYIGKAAYEVLRTQHGKQHHRLWNATVGGVVGELHATPVHEPIHAVKGSGQDPEITSSDWFAHKMGEILGRTEIWADVMSLGPPDGLFMETFQQALQKIAVRAHEQNKKVTIRMMFGNIIGMPLNCNSLIKELTELIPTECEGNIRMWVGAWRKGLSWNHAKMIAVDGIYLHTGGHNMWDYHYLKDSPVYDLSLELNGPVVHDGHLFANDQWEFVERVQATCCGEIAEKLPDSMPLIAATRVAVSEYPKGQTTEFPPLYKRRLVHEKLEGQNNENNFTVPMLTMGRYGSLLRFYRPADDAFLAMFASAKTFLRLAIQDLGPVCLPKTTIALPGCVWPKEYLTALGRAIMRGVDVEIVLSNPNSIPGGLSPTEANYGNGWSCVDVAAEIIKCIKKEFPTTKDETLRLKVQNNLRICFIRRGRENRNKYSTDMTIGLHSKHFIIDDRCAYVGSQNLYICDLAEWGVVIDHENSVRKMMKEFWLPLWQTSYTGTDVDVQAVMDGLKINRDGEAVHRIMGHDAAWKAQQDNALRAMGGAGAGGASKRHLTAKFWGNKQEKELDATDVEDN